MTEENAGSKNPISFFKKKIWIAAGIFSLVMILILLFKTLFSTILLILAGVLFAIYFHACAGFFQKKFSMSSGWALAISIILNLVLLTVFFWFVGSRLQNQISSLADTLPASIESARTQIKQTTVGVKVLDYMESSGNTEKTVSVAKRFFSSSFGILSDIYIILLLGMFFIADPFTYKKGFVHLLPVKAKDPGVAVLDKIHTILKNWIKGQLFGFLFIAVLSGLGLWALGMPLILTLALIAGLMNFIPNFGPIIALVPAILIAFTIGNTTVLLVIGLYTLIQVVQSAVTQPLIQKKMVSIPPALIIFGQVAMGLIAGFWGVLLATPVIAIIMTLVNELYVKKQESHKYEFEST